MGRDFMDDPRKFEKMKEEKNKLDELNKKQNLELQDLRYARVRTK